MKRNRRKQFGILLLAVVLLFGSALPAAAASQDVTQKYRSPVARMCRHLDSYLGYGCGRNAVFKYDIYAKTTMVYFMNLTYIYRKTIKQANRMCASDMKTYFGTTKTALKKFAGYTFPRNPSYLLRNRNGKVEYIGGNWGDWAPKGRVTKVLKTGSNKYEALYDIYYYDYYEHRTLSYMGTYKIYLKKARNKYGFTITNMKRTKTNNVWI